MRAGEYTRARARLATRRPQPRSRGGAEQALPPPSAPCLMQCDPAGATDVLPHRPEARAAAQPVQRARGAAADRVDLDARPRGAAEPGTLLVLQWRFLHAAAGDLLGRPAPRAPRRDRADEG